MKSSTTGFAFASLMMFSPIITADPWFTGPLLAPSAHTIPKGHTNLEVYGLNIISNGHYNSEGHVDPRPRFITKVVNPVVSHGLTDRIDVQFNIPYSQNSTLGIHGSGIGDVAAALGFQLLEQKQSPRMPDLKLSIQETFPTGRFQRLSPEGAGTDSTGYGSYQTQVALNFQYLASVFTSHYLRTRFSVSHIYYSPVSVHGLNSYGGTVRTNGTIEDGTENNLDLAFEFTLTQHWVAVMEGYWSHGQSTQFNSQFGIGTIGGPSENIGSGSYFEEGLAPALEYNFNENVGLIGGVWFPVKGTNSSHYTTYALALNAYW